MPADLTGDDIGAPEHPKQPPAPAPQEARP